MKACRQIAAFLCLLTFAFLPQLLLGQESVESLSSEATEDASDRMFWGMIKVVSFLVILGVLAFFARDFFRGRRLGRFKADPLKRLRVAEVCALGNRQFVFVIECGKERHLVGSSTHGIRYLSQLTSESEDSFESELDTKLDTELEPKLKPLEQKEHSK